MKKLGKWTRRALAVLPGIVVIAAAIGLWRLVRTYRPELREAELSFSWGLLVLASVLWLTSYVQLVHMWSGSLRWWKSRTLPLRPACRVFFLSNLARYIPGAVWQFAGLSALAAEEGASPTAASIGVILMQVATIATGSAIALSAAPRLVAPWVRGLGVVGQLVIAVVLIAFLVVVFPRLLPHLRGWLERVLKRPVPLPSPSPTEFAIYVLRTALSWVLYGAAFWVFSHAVLGPSGPSIWVAATAYIASYMVGLLAIFAPGGLVVREGALVLCLQPAIGYKRALILAISSRLWLVVLELVATLSVLAIDWVIKARGHRVPASASRK